MLHFAYGSNLDRAAMRRRCRGAVAEGPALLPGHRFAIMTNGYATVVPAPGQGVHGVLWRLTAADVATLDAYEDVAGGLYRRSMLTVMRGEAVAAMIYLGHAAPGGQPRSSYLDSIIRAARDWSLPQDYIESLRRPGAINAPRRALAAVSR